ncbi:MAG: hypothetical protein A3J38_08020 [Gammaproteobacteria bacterium RIFCSPHIGHO2_12_FULL_45_9]|nr:MAG: hypothetical protein A3J38_08020 [Gammaproteobacteria bacterium RIFCSPHIGHO2_12_FULL_45_9]
MNNAGPSLMLMGFFFCWVFIGFFRLTLAWVRQRRVAKAYLALEDVISLQERQTSAESVLQEWARIHKLLKQQLWMLSALIVLPIFYLVAIGFSVSFWNLFFVVAGILLVVLLQRSLTESKRQQKLIEQLPNTIDLIVQALSAETSLSETVHSLAKRLKDPIKKFFKKAEEHMTAGMTPAHAIQKAAKPDKLFEFDFFATVLVMHEETGSDTIRSLQYVSEVLREQRALQLKIKALTAEARMSTIVVGIIPLFILAFFASTQKLFIQLLFQTKVGHILLLIALVLYILGLTIIYQMAKVDK